MPVLARRAPILALFMLLLVAAPVRAEPRLTHEYDLKAAFLFQFTQFVQWPPEAFPARDAPLTIGILGPDPFGRVLDDIVANEAVGGHKLIVRRYESVSQVDSCQIVFVSPSMAAHLDSILPRLKRRGVLTVGETKEFAARSGIIGFVIVGKRLRLAINLAAANAAKLTISSKLLRQSQIVGPSEVRE